MTLKIEIPGATIYEKWKFLQSISTKDASLLKKELEKHIPETARLKPANSTSASSHSQTSQS